MSQAVRAWKQVEMHMLYSKPTLWHQRERMFNPFNCGNNGSGCQVTHVKALQKYLSPKPTCRQRPSKAPVCQRLNGSRALKHKDRAVAEAVEFSFVHA